MDRRATGDLELQQYGELFARERLRRHLTVAKVSQETRIRTGVIEAIERGDADSLPPAVFTLGLVRSYADFLGLDPAPYVTAYHTVVPDVPGGQIRPATSQITIGSGRGPATLGPVVVAVLVIVLVGYLYQQYHAFVSGADVPVVRTPGDSVFISTPLPTPPTAPPAVVASSVALIAPTATPVPRASTPTAALASQVTPLPVVPSPSPTATPNAGVRIDAQVLGRVWIQVQADDKVIYTGILNPGDARTWTASDKLMLWSGNGGNVSVSFNGKSLGKLGSPGEVVKVTWTATRT